MLNIAICDDDKKIRKEVTQICSRYLNQRNYKFDISIFTDGKDLTKSIIDYSIIFLDIEMPKVDGITAAKMIREHYKNTKIIFITNHTDYVMQSFSVRAFSYIKKPIDARDLENTLDDAISYYVNSLEPRYFEFKTPLGLSNIDLNTVLYFEFCDRKVKIVMFNQVLTTYTSIKKLSSELEDMFFCCSHSAYLINLSHVLAASKNTVVLQNNIKVPLAQKKSSKFKKCLVDYIQQKTLKELK